LTLEERTRAIAAKGYTDRQAQFLVTVMLHSGVCVVRQYCAFSGITRGRKTQDFFGSLIDRGHASSATDAHSKVRAFHVHNRGLYEVIGEPHNRNRKPVSVAAAVERLMILDAVLESPKVEWLATERDKLAHFTRTLGTSFRRLDLPHLTFGEAPRTTTRFFPDKLPIGLAANGDRTIFTFLITRSSPVDFRAFLHRHAELLRALPSWRLRLLIPSHLAGAPEAFTSALREELLSPLRLAAARELEWFFAARSDASPRAADEQERFERARRAFDAPRYWMLYRRWRAEGRSALDAVSSSALSDAINRGTGKVECHVLPHPYFHLHSLVGTA
jgi:hypothetical protein